MRSWFHLGLLWLIGVDLRLTLLAVPPVLPQIHHDLALNEKAVGALTALPVLLFGIAAIGGSLLIASIGARRATIVGLLLVAVAGAARGVGPETAILFGMTFAMGVGVAICQPAAPTLIGEWFPGSVGFATAVYVNGILAGEAISAPLTIPFVLPRVGGSWEWSFVVWSVPVLLTALVFFFFVPHVATHEKRVAWWPDWRDPLTWKLGILQAGISVLYFGLNAYMPDYFHTVGRPWMAGITIAVLNVAQFPGSLLAISIAHRITGKPQAFLGILAVAIPGVAALLAPQDWLTVVGVAILGTCSAIGLTMILALPPLAAHHGDIHRLSAGMFTIGYIGSFASTFSGGALWDATQVPATAFIPVVLGATVVGLLGTTIKLSPRA